MRGGVLLTRALADAERSAIRLAALGYDPLVAPVIAILPIASPLPHGDVDAIVVTSAHAVPALAAHRALLADRPIFAVGEHTALALREAGFPQAAAAAGSGLALARLIAAAMPSGTRLLHAAGRDRKSEPESALAAAGFALVPWVVYAAEAAPALSEAAARALVEGRLRYALHYSRRSLAILLDLATAQGLEGAVLDLSHACLSADIAALLRERGAGGVTVAARPDEEALLAALAAPTRSHDRTGSPAPQSRC